MALGALRKLTLSSGEKVIWSGLFIAMTGDRHLFFFVDNPSYYLCHCWYVLTEMWVETRSAKKSSINHNNTNSDAIQSSTAFTVTRGLIESVDVQPWCLCVCVCKWATKSCNLSAA